MKDSGIEWIGEIPASWSLQKGKYLFEQRNLRGNQHELQLLSPTQKYGVIPQSLYESLTGMNPVKLSESADLMSLKTIHKGDFCISLRSFQGGFEYSEYEGVVSPAYQVFYPIVSVADGYYKYLFKETGFIEKMNSYTMTLRDGKNIAFSDFGNTHIPYPPVEQQIAIASFLDGKCAEVDALSANVQAQIDALEQYKRSVITEAVTKGLDPDAQMKDSEIEWVGEIPTHWDIKPVRAVFKEVTRKNREGSVKVALKFAYGKIVRKNNFDADEDNYVADTILNYTVVEPGTIVLNGLNLNFDFITQRIGLVKELGIITSAYMTFRPIDDRYMSPEYATYLFKSYDSCKAFHNMGGGVRKILNFSIFKKTYVSVPPYEEQTDIIRYLNAKCAEIDTIIVDKRRQLGMLDSYKKSLIYEYITGKKEIPVA